MIFSASAAGRKWPCAATSRGKAALLAAGLLLVVMDATPAYARPPRSPFADVEAALFGKPRVKRSRPAVQVAVPLPQPRPQAAPPRIVEVPPKPAAVDVLPQPRPVEAPPPEKPPEAPPAADAPRAPPLPSACRLALTEQIAVAPSIPDIVGPGECGGEDLVRLDAVVLRDMTRVPLKPAATLRCEMASAVAAWVRDDLAPLANALGSPPATLDNFDSFDCRGRNRVAGAKVSEHGHANALDVRGFSLQNGVAISLTDRATARDTREKVLQSVCARFTTVLGPGSDGYHEDHIHLDLAARRSGYRICQWTIQDPMPAIAPLMPAPRPDDAPPRPEVASDKQSEARKPEAEPQNAEDDAEPAPAPPPQPAKKRSK